MTVDPALLTMVTVVLTGTGTVMVQLFRENRNHRWDQKERELLAAKLLIDNNTVAAALAKKLAEDQAALALKLSQDQAALALKLSQDQADHLRQRRDADRAAAAQIQTELTSHRALAKEEANQLIVLVSENTVLTKAAIDAAHAAFLEANNINKKIAALGIEHNDLATRQHAVVQELAGIGRVVIPVQPPSPPVVETTGPVEFIKPAVAPTSAPVVTPQLQIHHEIPS